MLVTEVLNFQEPQKIRRKTRVDKWRCAGFRSSESEREEAGNEATIKRRRERGPVEDRNAFPRETRPMLCIGQTPVNLLLKKPSGNIHAKPLLEVSESKDTSRSGSGTMQGDTAVSLGQHRCR